VVSEFNIPSFSNEPEVPVVAHHGLRVSFFRVLAVLVVAGVATFGVFHYGQRAIAASVSKGPTAFAAYVDVTATPTYHFEVPTAKANLNTILGFIVADTQTPCTPSWGTYYTLDAAQTQLDIDRRIAQLRLMGGDVRVSFGGAANSELSVSCTDPVALSDAYKLVIERYNLTSIDLDIEGSGLEKTPANARLVAAMKSVQDWASKTSRKLNMWMTLPVGTDGLTHSGFNLVESMLKCGVYVAGVNGMTMDFGASKPASQSMTSAVEDASTQLQRQIDTAYQGVGQSLSQSALWNKVGITPMIGQNDVPGEKFTIQDAKDINAFARSKGVGLISMWSLNRDNTCLLPTPMESVVVQTYCSGVDQGTSHFSVVLDNKTSDIAFSSPTPPVTSPRDLLPIVDDPSQSPYPIWNANSNYPANTKVVWKRNVYQAKYWTKGYAPNTPVVHLDESPWQPLGPVLLGEKPIALPTLPAGTYQAWNAGKIYNQGDRVQVGLVPYQAKWWTQNEEPTKNSETDSAWALITPPSQIRG